MDSILRKFLAACLLAAALLAAGCGDKGDPVTNPGEGEDAPVMDEVPDATP